MGFVTAERPNRVTSRGAGAFGGNGRRCYRWHPVGEQVGNLLLSFLVSLSVELDEQDSSRPFGHYFVDERPELSRVTGQVEEHLI